MVPNLALAQRLFLALRQEDRHPVTDILRQTPGPAAGLPVGDPAAQPRRADAVAGDRRGAGLHVPRVRRRPADPAARRHPPPAGAARWTTTAGGSSCCSACCSRCPGAPVIYYGDEIGMGDNVFLGGRAGVRTPMQWAPDRNAGFSSADAARLFAPPVADPVYGYQAVNVEAQRRDPSSLVPRDPPADRRPHAGRRRCRAGGSNCWNRPTARWSRSSAGSATSRSWSSPTCRATAQPVELDLAAFAGLVPVEMFGQDGVPADRRPAVPAHPGSARLLLVPAADGGRGGRLPPRPGGDRGGRGAADPRPSPAAGTRSSTARPAASWSATVLPGYLRSQRWFGGKARDVARRPRGRPGAAAGAATAFLVAAGCRVRRRAPGPVLPAAGRGRRGRPRSGCCRAERGWVVARLRGPSGEAVLHDALADDAVCTALLDAVAAGQEFRDRRRPDPGRVDRRVRPAPRRPRTTRCRSSAGRPRRATRSSSSAGGCCSSCSAGWRPGTNPDFEIGRFLTEDSPFDRIPQVAGTLEYHRPDGGRMSRSAILQALVPNQGDGWEHAIDELGRYYERAAGPDGRPGPGRPGPAAAARAGRRGPAAGRPGDDRQLPARGRHARPAHRRDAPGPGRRPRATRPSPPSRSRPPTWTPLGRDPPPGGAGPGRPAGEPRPPAGRRRPRRRRSLLETGAGRSEGPAAGRCRRCRRATKIRIHGDYHLGQVLWVDNDFVILDFEGEPTRPVARAAGQAVAAQGRGRDAPLVPLRRLRRPVRLHPRPARTTSPAWSRGPTCGTSGRRPRSCATTGRRPGGRRFLPGRRPSSRPCWTRSCSARRSTSWSTS